MLKNIYIKNFKSLRETPHIPIKNLNLFTGMNGMGKSSLIQVLLLLRQSILSQNDNDFFLKLNGSLIQLGTTVDVICENRSSNNLEFILEHDTNLKSKIAFDYFPGSPDDTEFEQNLKTSNIHKNFKDSNLFSSAFEYLNAERISPRPYYQNQHILNQYFSLGNFGENTIEILHVLKDNEISIKALAHPKAGYFDDLKQEFVKDYNLIEQLNAWLSEISPNIVFKPEVDYQKGISSSSFSFKQPNSPNTNYYRSNNVGFGVTYVLPVVTALLKSKPGDIIIIENPEAHIHPKGQSKLTELMALAAQNGVQLFIETHSDHVFYSLRVAIKEGLIDADKAIVNFFKRDEKKHISLIEQISIDEEGRIDKYPDDFFDQYDINLTKLI